MTAQPEPDYYARLGVPETATDAEIASAFRRLARRLHPDVNPGAPLGPGRFTEAAAAYDVLGNRARREAYDAARNGRSRGGTSIPVRQAGARRAEPSRP